jgi:hypothetical protein
MLQDFLGKFLFGNWITKFIKSFFDVSIANGTGKQESDFKTIAKIPDYWSHNQVN